MTDLRYVKKFAVFSIGPFMNGLIGFLSLPILTWFISPENLGRSTLFAVFQSVACLFVLLGLDQAYLREYNDSRDKPSLIVSLAFLPILLSFLMGLLAFVLWRPVSIAVCGQADFAVTAMLAFSIPLMTANRFFELVLRMSERAIAYTSISVTSKIGSVVTLILSAKFMSNGFYAVMISSVVSISIGLFAYCVICRSELEGWMKAKIDLRITKKALAFATPLIPYSVLWFFFDSLDRLMLRSLVSFEELGIYNGAMKIVSVILIFQQAFVLYWVPLSYRWHAKGKELKSYLEVGDAVTALMALLYTILVANTDLVFLVVGSKYRPSAKVLPLLFLIPLLYTVSEVAVIGINFAKKTVYHLFVIIIASCVSITSCLVFIPLLGIVGAAIAVSLSYFSLLVFRAFFGKKSWALTLNGRMLTTLVLCIVSAVFAVCFPQYSRYLNLSLLLIFIINLNSVSRLAGWII